MGEKKRDSLEAMIFLIFGTAAIKENFCLILKSIEGIITYFNPIKALLDSIMRHLIVNVDHIGKKTRSITL